MMSSHLRLGLPLGLLVKGFHLNITCIGFIIKVFQLCIYHCVYRSIYDGMENGEK